MNKITINILFPGLLVLCGVFFFLGGIFISFFPVPVIYLGYLGFIAGLFWAICLLVPRPKWTFRIFILCWAVGACVTTFFIIPISIVAMFSTAFVHLPLLALTCHVANQKGKTRYSISTFYALSFIFALFLPHYTMIQFKKPYPQNPEQIKISADLLEDKNPPYIDEDSMWLQETLKNTFFREEITARINKSAAVVALDLGELEDDEKPLTGKLFPTYQKALAYAQVEDLPVIPSVQLIDHKAKVFADRFYAVLENYLQNHALAFEGGKQAFLQRLLQELIQNNDDSPAHLQATAYIAAGLHLGGGELPPLPEKISALQQKMEKDFLADPLNSKPVGFYNETDNLRRIFQQDRFLQTNLDLESAIALARILKQNSSLRKQYQVILATYARLTNPPSRFSVDDVTDYEAFFDDPAQLRKQMLQSDKWKLLVKRGAGREQAVFGIQFLPHSTSKENELFAKIYNESSDLPGHNIMNRLIQAILAGEIDLTPTDDSGWYDYQIHALETLLVTEKGLETEKLLLSEKYKKRLIEAFKTILTKKRELHVKQVEIIRTLGMKLGPGRLSVIISPDLNLEPTATYYLRTARGFGFIINALELILGPESLQNISMDNGDSLPVAVEEMIRLYYGLYLVVCQDLGMLADFMPDEMTDTRIQQAHEQAIQWLQEYDEDPACAKDVRYIVSALSNQNRTQVRYWITVGIKLLKIKAEYAKRPRVLILDPETGETIQELPADSIAGPLPEKMRPLQYNFAPEEFYLPVEVFAEATGPAHPFTRDEFRNLCDKYQNKDKIIHAIENKMILSAYGRIIIAGVIILLILIVTALFYITRFGARPNKFISRSGGSF